MIKGLESQPVLFQYQRWTHLPLEDLLHLLLHLDELCVVLSPLVLDLRQRVL